MFVMIKERLITIKIDKLHLYITKEIRLHFTCSKTEKTTKVCLYM